MTTLADAIKTALEDNWTGAGGAEPPMFNSEDYAQQPMIDDDWILILQETYVEEMTLRRNESFVRRRYEIQFVVSTKGDANLEERLDELVAECYRIVTPSTVTGYHVVDIIRQVRLRNVAVQRYQATLTVQCIIRSTDSATTPGTLTESIWTIDELTVNTSITSSGTLSQVGQATFNIAPINLAGVYLFNASELRCYNIDGSSRMYLYCTGATGAGVGVIATDDDDIDIIPAGVLNIKPSGDTDDYFEFSTVSNIPTLTLKGTHEMHVKSDGATGVGIVLQEDATNKLLLNWDKIAKKGIVRAYGGPLQFQDSVYTITSTQIADLLMFGAANAAWEPCAFEGSDEYTKALVASDGTLENVDDTNFNAYWVCTLPATKGGLKLYIAGTMVSLSDADADDKITARFVYGYTGATRDTIDTTADDLTTVDDHEDTFTAVDCSGYAVVKIRLQASCTNAGGLNINGVSIKAYYA